MTRAISGVFLAVTALVAQAEPAWSADPARDAVVACRSISDASLRLACFDRTVPALVGAPGDSAAPLVRPLPAQRPPEARFGEERMARDPAVKAEEVDEIRAKVAAVSVNRNGRLVIDLVNGQRWVQNGTDRSTVQAGSDVTISRGLLGTFDLKVDGSNFVIKVSRRK